MSSYHIYFRNEFSSTDSDYTLWRDTPFVSTRTGDQVPAYSNSFLNRNVPRDGTWSIDVNNAPYAFCGVSKNEELQPGDKVSDTGHKLVKIVGDGNGSTVVVYDNKGTPAFAEDVSYLAHPGTFEIVTESGFGDYLKFVGGYSGMDSDGRPRPLATFKIGAGQEYYVKRNAKFYMGNFASQPGELIDPYLSGAVIDFDSKPGLFNAIVIRNANGSFTTNIVSSAVFAMETAAAAGTASSPSNVQLTQLKHQAKLMSSLIDAALGISSVQVEPGRYRCTAEWANKPSIADQAKIMAMLKEFMEELGYKLEYVTIWGKLSMIFTHAPPLSLRAVVLSWLSSIYVLGQVAPGLYKYITNPGVERLTFDTAETSPSEPMILPPEVSLLPKPQWRCSVDWSESLADPVRNLITLELLKSMGERGYLRVYSDSSATKLSIDFFHLPPTNLKTATADWQRAYDNLGAWAKLFVRNPQTQALYHTQDLREGQVDGASAGIPIPTEGHYIGALQWLEGPNNQTKKSIIQQLKDVLVQRGNKIGHVIDLIGADTLLIGFSHDQPTSIEQAKADWLAAYNKIKEGFQGMYIFNPRVELDNDVHLDPIISTEKRYLGCLTWLEGPSREVRDSIIAQMGAVLRERQNRVQPEIEIGDDLLIIPFSHDEPSSLEQAQKDWLAAYETIKRGFQGMYITNPFCDEDTPIYLDPPETSNGANGTNGVALPASDDTQQPVAPAPAVSAMESTMSMSLEEKKRRALELLAAEGLIGSGISVA